MAGFEAPIDSIRGSEAYKKIGSCGPFAEHKQSDMVDLVDDALAAYAKARDYKSPSEAIRSIVP